jgi:hypothetical protein
MITDSIRKSQAIIQQQVKPKWVLIPIAERQEIEGIFRKNVVWAKGWNG